MKKIVLIGGSRGIGRELGLLLSEAHEVLLLSRNMAALEKIAEEGGANLHVAQLDLQSPGIKEDLSSAVSKQFSNFNILINNAGYLVNKPVLEFTKEDISQMITTNTTALIESCQALIPLMNEGGHIVNIGSMGGFQGSAKFPGLSVYSASKAAVAAFSECLAVELADRKISSNCLALGAAQTEMLEAAFPGYQAPVSAEQMADFIAEFALSGNNWMNGKTIPVALSNPS